MKHDDIFAYWGRIRRDEFEHPDDRDVLRMAKHGFNLRCLPAAFFGPLQTAPVVFLYLSPGFTKPDLADAQSAAGRERYARTRGGFMHRGRLRDEIILVVCSRLNDAQAPRLR